jgi:hypothetical protein
VSVVLVEDGAVAYDGRRCQLYLLDALAGTALALGQTPLSVSDFEADLASAGWPPDDGPARAEATINALLASGLLEPVP